MFKVTLSNFGGYAPVTNETGEVVALARRSLSNDWRVIKADGTNWKHGADAFHVSSGEDVDHRICAEVARQLAA